MWNDVEEAQALVDLFNDDLITESEQVKGALAAANDLVRIGAPAVEPLLQLLSNADLRYIAIFALGQIGDIRAVDPLIELLSELDIVGNQDLLFVVTALASIGDARAVAPLLELMTRAQEGALRAPKPRSLLHSDPVEVFTTWLIRHRSGLSLRDEQDRYLRVCLSLHLIWALGRIGDPRAIEALRARVSDPDPDISKAAQQALDQLTGGTNHAALEVGWVTSIASLPR